MSSFYLKILASNKVFFSGKADILVVPGLDGEIAIMAHHQNMAIATTIGDVRFKPEGSEESSARERYCRQERQDRLC